MVQTQFRSYLQLGPLMHNMFHFLKIIHHKIRRVPLWYTKTYQPVPISGILDDCLGILTLEITWTAQSYVTLLTLSLVSASCFTACSKNFTVLSGGWCGELKLSTILFSRSTPVLMADGDILWRWVSRTECNHLPDQDKSKIRVRHFCTKE